MGLYSWKQNVVEKYQFRIRESAITKAKARIALSGRKISDLDEDELEVIVKEEQEKITASAMKSIGMAMLIYVGIT